MCDQRTMYKYTLYTCHTRQALQVARATGTQLKLRQTQELKLSLGNPGQPTRRKANQEGFTSTPRQTCKYSVYTYHTRQAPQVARAMPEWQKGCPGWSASRKIQQGPR